MKHSIMSWWCYEWTSHTFAYADTNIKELGPRFYLTTLIIRSTSPGIFLPNLLLFLITIGDNWWFQGVYQYFSLKRFLPLLDSCYDSVQRWSMTHSWIDLRNCDILVGLGAIHTPLPKVYKTWTSRKMLWYTAESEFWEMTPNECIRKFVTMSAPVLGASGVFECGLEKWM